MFMLAALMAKLSNIILVWLLGRLDKSLLSTQYKSTTGFNKRSANRRCAVFGSSAKSGLADLAAQQKAAADLAAQQKAAADLAAQQKAALANKCV